MKKYLAVVMIVFSMLVLASAGWALTVSGTNVGDPDTLLNPGGTQLANSGAQTEINWINGILGTSYTTGDVTSYPNNWQLTDDGNYMACALNDSPEYYYIKTGNLTPGHGVTQMWYLFDNNDVKSWAVVDFSDTQIVEIGQISHIGGLGGSVPEPSMLMLFGSGILGLGLFGRKKIG